MTRQKSSSLDAITADCRECQWFSGERNALGQAAQHHDRTGHTVVVVQTTTVMYGDPAKASSSPAQAAWDERCRRSGVLGPWVGDENEDALTL